MSQLQNPGQMPLKKMRAHIIRNEEESPKLAIDVVAPNSDAMEQCLIAERV